MKQRSPTHLLFLLLSLALPAVADMGADARVEAGLRDLVDTRGSLVELTTASGPFVAIHRARQRGDGRGGVVLLHDQGAGPDSLAVVRPLRLGLAEAGWETLSLQLPHAYAHQSPAAWRARTDLIQARLKAGLDWLKSRGLLNQVIVAHGESGAIALDFAATKAPPELQAVVLISATWWPPDSDAGAQAGARPELPLLDIYAERDAAAVIDAAAARRIAAIRDRDPGFRQVTVPGAQSGFHVTSGDLLARVRAWLAANAKSTAVRSERGRELVQTAPQLRSARITSPL